MRYAQSHGSENAHPDHARREPAAYEAARAERVVVSTEAAAEFEIDAQLVRALLREQHPDLAGLPLDAMESGWDNTLFRLGQRWVVRLPRRALSAPLFEHEQRWLPVLAGQLPLPVPAPLRRGSPSAGYPWHWSVVEWLPGTAADLSPPNSKQARVLARFLRALHVPAPSSAPRNPYRGVPLQERALVVEQRLQAIAPLSPRIHDIWARTLDARIDLPPTWLHGDLHARNVLVDDGRYSARLRSHLATRPRLGRLLRCHTARDGPSR